MKVQKEKERETKSKEKRKLESNRERGIDRNYIWWDVRKKLKENTRKENKKVHMFWLREMGYFFSKPDYGYTRAECFSVIHVHALVKLLLCTI